MMNVTSEQEDTWALEPWNRTTADMVADQMDLIFGNYLGPAVCCVGIICNILNLLILTERSLKESPYAYLTALASTDLAVMVLSFVFLVFANSNRTKYSWGFFTIYIFYPFTNICSHSSIWIVLMLTVERFLFVRYPLWARDRCNRRSAKIKITVIILVMFVFNLSRFFQFRLEELPGNNGTVVLNVGNNATFFLAINWFHSIVINFGPLLVLCFCNAYLVVAVRRARQQRRDLNIRNNRESQFQSDQMRLTITLISIVFLFIVCVLPSAVADRPIAYMIFGNTEAPDLFPRKAPYRILQSTSNFLVWCNTALNFILYCAFNDKFVRVFKKMLQRWGHKLRCTRQERSILKLISFKNGHTTMSRENESATRTTSY